MIRGPINARDSGEEKTEIPETRCPTPTRPTLIREDATLSEDDFNRGIAEEKDKPYYSSEHSSDENRPFVIPYPGIEIYLRGTNLVTEHWGDRFVIRANDNS